MIVGGGVGVGLLSYLSLGGAYQSFAIESRRHQRHAGLGAAAGIVDGRRQAHSGHAMGVALASAGTLLIVTKRHIEALTAVQFNLGHLWSLLAAMAFAWFSVRLRDWIQTMAPLALTVMTAWSGLIVVMLPVYAV